MNVRVLKWMFVVAIATACSNASDTQVQSALDTVKTGKTKIRSFLEILDVESGVRTLVYSSDTHFEAPNWTKDDFLIYNSAGKLYKIGAEEGALPEEIPTGFATNCNNDHLISPDGKQIAVSHHEQESGLSKIYTLPISGGTPVLVTQEGPSYLHGWSPDGKTLAYCAERNGDYNIFEIGVNGGKERPLTDAKGLDDGPEYGPDGKYIYFNSVRSGKMKIWRMKADGSEQRPLTQDAYQDWFPHVSPDNRKVVFISYDTTIAAGSHPPNKNVWLRIMDKDSLQPRVLLPLFGGQGTINVPSWSPDSKKIAFVRYEKGK